MYLLWSVSFGKVLNSRKISVKTLDLLAIVLSFVRRSLSLQALYPLLELVPCSMRE